MDQKFKRPYLGVVVVPQLVILVAFLCSRASVWAGLLKAQISFSSFSYELLSAGGGWVMLSLSTLTLSVAFCLENRSHYVAAIQDKFQTIPASTVLAKLNEDILHHRLAFCACLWLFTVFAAIGVSSIIHWNVVTLESSQVGVAWVALLSLVVCGWAFCHGIDFSLKPHAFVAESLQPGLWGLETTYQWKMRLAHGGIDTPEVADLVQKALDQLMEKRDFRAAFAEHVTKCHPTEAPPAAAD